MSIRVDMVPVIDFDEIENEFKVSINQFEFYHREDEDLGYFFLDTDCYAIEDREYEIEQEIECAEKYEVEIDTAYIERVRNDIKLISLLREMGLTDGALIYVWN